MVTYLSPLYTHQVRQQQSELRGFIYRRDASELFYRKAALTLSP